MMRTDDGHYDFVDLFIIAQSDKHIDEIVILDECVWHSILVIYNIRTDRRYREPYLDVHLPGEFPDLYDILLIGNRELVAIEEDAVRLE